MSAIDRRSLRRAAVARARPVVGPLIRNTPGRRPRWGNLRRFRPFSAHYGFERGLPVDRIYIERFLERHRLDIAGDVLEVRDGAYARRFGDGRIRALHVLDVDAANPDATMVGDLCRPGVLAHASLDCVVLTQVLPYLDDPAAALHNAWEALRPGGTLLVTAPCLARIDPDAAGSDRWRMTPLGLEHALARSCPGAAPQVTAHGNLVASLAFLLGLAGDELTDAELALDDPRFPLVACGRARRPGGPA